MEVASGCDEAPPVTRLFVGGLGASVNDHDLEEMMGTLGRVHSVEMVRSNDRNFAYVDFETESDAALRKLFSTYNGCKWKGGRLRVEKAKEPYLSRLKREWAIEEKATVQRDFNGQKELFEADNTMLKATSEPRRPKSRVEGLKIYFPKTKKVKFIPDKGLGKHKRSFQRFESLPLCLLTVCSCKEHQVENADCKTDMVFQHEFERSARVIKELEYRLAYAEESQQLDTLVAEAEVPDCKLGFPEGMMNPSGHQPHSSEPEHRKAQMTSRSKEVPDLNCDFTFGKDILNRHNRLNNASERRVKHVDDSLTPLASLDKVPENNLRDLSERKTLSNSLSSNTNWEKVFKAAGGNQLPSSGAVQGAALHLSDDDDQTEEFSKLLRNKALIKEHSSMKTDECTDIGNVSNVPLLNTRMLDFNTSVSGTAYRNPDADRSPVATTFTRIYTPEASERDQKETESHKDLVPQLCNKETVECSKWVQKASWKSLVGDTGLVGFSLRDVIGERQLQSSDSSDKGLNSSDVKAIVQPATCVAEAKSVAPLRAEACKPSRSSIAAEIPSTKQKSFPDIRQPENYLVKGSENDPAEDSTRTKKLEGVQKRARLADILMDGSKHSSEAFPFKENSEMLKDHSESDPVTDKAELENGSPPWEGLLGNQVCSFMRSPNAESEWLALRDKLKADYKSKHKAAMRRTNASIF